VEAFESLPCLFCFCPFIEDFLHFDDYLGIRISFGASFNFNLGQHKDDFAMIGMSFIVRLDFKLIFTRLWKEFSLVRLFVVFGRVKCVFLGADIVKVGQFLISLYYFL